MTETWIRIPSFGDYIVSNAGRVRHRRVNAPILKGSYDKDGYHRVGLNGCTIRTHVVVAEAFHGPRPEGLEVAHLDGDCRNNCASNLTYATPSENNRHKKAQGRPNGHKPTRLTEDQLEAIRHSPLSSRKAATEFGVSQCHVVRIRNGTRIRKASPKGQHHGQ